jgi:epoxide hydrolase
MHGRLRWVETVSRGLGIVDPSAVIGVHLNTLHTPPPDDPAELAELSCEDRMRLDRLVRAQPEMSGYAMVQGTRPRTIAYALTDSPVGQLAWIVEKFKESADCKERPEDAVDRDLLLTNVMLYWLTRTAGSAANLYYETMHGSAAEPRRSTVPTGVAVFGRDIAAPVRRLAERDNRIVHWSEFDRGGHFAAMEEPDLFVSDVRTFFRTVRGIGRQRGDGADQVRRPFGHGDGGRVGVAARNGRHHRRVSDPHAGYTTAGPDDEVNDQARGRPGC